MRTYLTYLPYVPILCIWTMYMMAYGDGLASPIRPSVYWPSCFVACIAS